MPSGRPIVRVALALAAAALAGCSAVDSLPAASTQTGISEPGGRVELGSLTYRAVDRLVAQSPGITHGHPVVVGSIADVQRVERSAPLGNLIADLVRSRLVQKGVSVSEIRLRSAVAFDKGQGEMTLANDRNDVVPPPSAAGILTGTYATGDDWVYISLKLVSVDNARIIGAVDYAIPRRGSEALLYPPPAT